MRPAITTDQHQVITSTIDGFVQLGEVPEYNVDISMKTIELVDIIPDDFHPHIGGLADLELRLTGSPNRSDGIIFEGELVMVEGGRFDQVSDTDLAVFIAVVLYNLGFCYQMRHFKQRPRLSRVRNFKPNCGLVHR